MIFRKEMTLPDVFLDDPYGLHIRVLESVDRPRREGVSFSVIPDPKDPKLCKAHVYAGSDLDETFTPFEIPRAGRFVLSLNPVKKDSKTKRRVPLWESGELSGFIKKAIEYYFQRVKNLRWERVKDIYLMKMGTQASPIHTVRVFGEYEGLAEDFNAKLLAGFGKCRSFGYGTPIFLMENEENR